MKRLLLASLVVLAAVPAQAISRYNSQKMTCASARQKIADEGAVILRHYSKRHPNLLLYDRYVSSGGECAMGQGPVLDTVPTADNPQCEVLRCRDITYDEPDN